MPREVKLWTTVVRALRYWVFQLGSVTAPPEVVGGSGCRLAHDNETRTVLKPQASTFRYVAASGTCQPAHPVAFFCSSPGSPSPLPIPPTSTPRNRTVVPFGVDDPGPVRVQGPVDPGRPDVDRRLGRRRGLAGGQGPRGGRQRGDQGHGPGTGETESGHHTLTLADGCAEGD